MNWLVWVALGLGLYWLLVVTLRARGVLPPSVRIFGPLVTIRTLRGRILLDRIASPKRFWRAWGNFGLGIALVVMLGAFLVLLVNAALVLINRPEPTLANQPRNVLVIPGVNEFLPLSVAPEIVFGLLVGLVVHEGGHGILCRVEDIDIESMGVALLTVVPMGAFVEPDEESQRQADRGARSRMFAAGVTNNFLVTVIVFALLFGPVVGAIGVAGGAAVGGVFEGSSAATAGIDRGDRIVAVDDRRIESNEDLQRALSTVESETVAVELADGTVVQVERSLLVVGVSPDSPFAPPLVTNQTLVSVNDTAVRTEAQLARALADGPTVTLTTANGTTATGPAGALVTVLPDEPLAAAGAPAGESIVVTGVDGAPIRSSTDLQDALEGTDPGQQIRVRAAVDGASRTYDVTLADGGDGSGFLGVTIQPGVSGVSVNGFGTDLYPAASFLDLLDGGDGGGPVQSFVVGVFVVLLLPIAKLVPAVPLSYNFVGFTGWNANFFVVEGALEPLGGGVLVLANLLFWTGWINLQLGFFNCIPAFPLDGGHILRMGTEAVVSRLPDGVRDPVVARTVTTGVGLVMLASLLTMLFGPQLLA